MRQPTSCGGEIPGQWARVKNIAPGLQRRSGGLLFETGKPGTNRYNSEGNSDFTPAGTVACFESLDFPGFPAYVVIVAELLGGVALILGLWSR